MLRRRSPASAPFTVPSAQVAVPPVTVAPPASSTVVPAGSVRASVVVSNGAALRFPKRSTYSSVSPNPTGSRSSSSVSTSGAVLWTVVVTPVRAAAPVTSSTRAVAWMRLPSAREATVTSPTNCTVRLPPAGIPPRSHSMSRPATQAAGTVPPSVTARQPAVL